MTTKPQHTPTPWTVHGSTIIRAIKEGRIVYIAEAKVDMPALRDITESQKVRLEESVANAAFILQACNSFDDLLVAAEALDHNMGSLQTAGWVRLRAAIAKAKGEA